MIRNVGLTSALNIYRAGIQFGLNIVLAHFLSPADFGLVALVLPITLFILLIGDFGVTTAIVRNSASPEQAGAAATICINFGGALVALTLLLYGLGVFRTMPAPVDLLLIAFSVVALLAMVAIVPRAMIERRLRYGRITWVETASNSLGFLVAIVAAWWGAGVWSFAAYHLAMQASRAAAFAYLARHEVATNTQLRLALPLLGFGGWVVAFNLVNYLMRNFDRYLVGGMIGTGPLGIYAFSYQIMLVPLMTITWPVSGVLLSTLSRLKDHPAQQREAFLAVLMIASSLTFPMMAFVALRAGPIFELLLPHRWSQVGDVISNMALAGGLQSVTSLVGSLFMIQGRVRLQFWFGVFATALTLATVGVAAYLTHSIVALAQSYAVLTAILSIAYLFMIARMLSTTILVVVKAILPALLIALSGFLAVELMDLAMPSHAGPLVRLIADTVAFLGTWGLFMAVRSRSFVALLKVMRSTSELANRSVEQPT